ncbi:hypothetical protein [Stenotrophomonas sp. CFBP8980]|jgi:hypothetical protein|uniref:hypothetical protein n=1 Tax=Stenotrophomonas sp. CFBP8980 TaxID=3096523 RepID=UPI0005AEDAFA|nr:hypothetical protein [Stenotrophomonas sp. CFBP8980]KIP81754.1 membrane protein [Stenotrophomonas maltophilia]MDY1034542.1 hypothetical protein [Stenotrophomonas sp. CFBP8980]
MVIYRGAGFFTLLTPIVAVLLLLWLYPDPSVAKGNITLAQFLLGCGIGAAINVVLGVVLNRGVRPEGVPARHHFFYLPMQWPSLAIVLACAVVAVLR